MGLSRACVIAGSVALLLSAALHSLGGFRVGFPALAAAHLSQALQSAFAVVFISLAWLWLVLAAIALLAAFTPTKLSRPLVLICGLAVLLEAIAGTVVMGWFIGNAIIAVAGILLVSGGLLLPSPLAPANP
ncbi:MAG TPA: hypothetical protein VFP94_04825 [Terriglobales bacterium]|nr:hypothetical protein [Terriglobales bacterium]